MSLPKELLKYSSAELDEAYKVAKRRERIRNYKKIEIDVRKLQPIIDDILSKVKLDQIEFNSPIEGLERTLVTTREVIGRFLDVIKDSNK